MPARFLLRYAKKSKNLLEDTKDYINTKTCKNSSNQNKTQKQIQKNTFHFT